MLSMTIPKYPKCKSGRLVALPCVQMKKRWFNKLYVFLKDFSDTKCWSWVYQILLGCATKKNKETGSPWWLTTLNIYFSLSFLSPMTSLWDEVQASDLHNMSSYFLTPRYFWEIFFPQQKAQEQKSRQKLAMPLKLLLDSGIHPTHSHPIG